MTERKAALPDGGAGTRNNRRAIGTHYEELAAGYLREQGLRILVRNFRTRFGEIDLIAEDAGTLVFVEVKYRSSAGKGAPEEAVGREKQAVIRKQACAYLASKGLNDLTPCRFDVIAVLGDRIRWIRNAF